MTENVAPVSAAASQSPDEVPARVRDDERASSKEMVEIVEALLAAWDRPGRGQIEFSQRGHTPNLGRLAVITSLASHVHRLADSVLLLTRAGHNIQAIPLIRAAYEIAITVQWVAQAGDGIEALMNKWMRSRQVLGEEMSAMRLEHLQEIGADILQQDLITDQETTSGAQGRSFRDLCHDFQGGDELYIHYRGMSAYLHPSERVSDQYVSIRDDGRMMFTAVPKFNQKDFSEARAWLFMLTWSLILAARAFDFVDRSKTTRSMLRRFGRQLGVPSELRLTDEASRRIRLGASRI